MIIQLLRVAALLSPSESFGCVEKAKSCRVMQWRSDYETDVWCSFNAHAVTETPGSLTAECRVAMCCTAYGGYCCFFLLLTALTVKLVILFIFCFDSKYVWDGMLSRLFLVHMLHLVCLNVFLNYWPQQFF